MTAIPRGRQRNNAENAWTERVDGASVQRVLLGGMSGVWTEHRTPEGRAYFFNSRLKRTVWALPPGAAAVPSFQAEAAEQAAAAAAAAAAAGAHPSSADAAPAAAVGSAAAEASNPA